MAPARPPPGFASSRQALPPPALCPASPRCHQANTATWTTPRPFLRQTASHRQTSPVAQEDSFATTSSMFGRAVWSAWRQRLNIFSSSRPWSFSKVGVSRVFPSQTKRTTSVVGVPQNGFFPSKIWSEPRRRRGGGGGGVKRAPAGKRASDVQRAAKV